MPVPLRTDFDAAALRAIARQTKDGPQARRLLALAAIYEGASRTEAARIGGVTVQIVRDWVVKFNAHGPAGPGQPQAARQPSKLTDAHRAALVARGRCGPDPGDPWRGALAVDRSDPVDLGGVPHHDLQADTCARELRAMDYRKLSARPRHHAKSEAAVSAFKKTSRPVWRRSGRRSAASRSRSGSPMRPGSVRRTRSPAAGPNAAPALQPRKTKGPPRPTSLAPSARRRGKAWAWFCPAAPPRA